jgi:hypothetical protein
MKQKTAQLFIANMDIHFVHVCNYYYSSSSSTLDDFFGANSSYKDGS